MADEGQLDHATREALMVEQQKAQFQLQVHRLTDVCWEKCLDKPRDKLDSRTEQCFTNCVERFIDVSLLISNRFSQLIQRSVQH